MQKAIPILISKMRKQLGAMELNENTSMSNIENTTPNESIPSQESSVTHHATSIRSPYSRKKFAMPQNADYSVLKAISKDQCFVVKIKTCALAVSMNPYVTEKFKR
jgi:hypothetical protein